MIALTPSNPMLPVDTIPDTPAVPTVPAVVAVPTITFDDFLKVDLRVGRITAAENIPKAKKILKLTVDLGEAEPRTVLAGIALAYKPEQVIGRNIAVVTNLAPREMFGFTSNGMLLAAPTATAGLVLVDIPGDPKPGTRIG